MTEQQERSLLLHCAVAAHLRERPDEVMAHARANLMMLRRVHADGRSEHWFAQWESALAGGTSAVEELLVSRAPTARELRTSSPFAGVLRPGERKLLLRSLREEQAAGAS